MWKGLNEKELLAIFTEQLRDSDEVEAQRIRENMARISGECDKPKKRNKYNATKKVVDGITFDSAKEARRYTELKWRQWQERLAIWNAIRNMSFMQEFVTRQISDIPRTAQQGEDSTDIPW